MFFESGLKKFMHEPGYILEYADFLCRLNDDRNVRALFERALSLLPPEESVEVWKRFTQFEQTYGDLASMLKVEQRRKEALSRTGEDGLSTLEGSLHDVVSRCSFMDLWPCSAKDLDHLARQEWLAKNVNKKIDKSTLSSSVGNSPGAANAKIPAPSTKVVYPDTSQMVIYDPRQKTGPGFLPNANAPGLPAVSAPILSTANVALGSSGAIKGLDEILKALPPALVTFIAHLPSVEGTQTYHGGFCQNSICGTTPKAEAKHLVVREDAFALIITLLGLSATLDYNALGSKDTPNCIAHGSEGRVPKYNIVRFDAP
ncbi:Cleavage stimulation factor subunit 77 [Asimina triloba]